MVKLNRDLVDFLRSENPHVAVILQGSVSRHVVRSFGSSGIVYDLSVIRYYGLENMLSEYGHYYHSNGGNKEINFVMAVTRDSGIRVHHRIMPGNMVSISTVGNLVSELKDLGIHSVMIVMDRGFCTGSNMKELKDHNIIGSIPGMMSKYFKLIRRSSRIENSRNYTQYGNYTIFHKEFMIEK